MFCSLETKRLVLKNIGYDDADFILQQFSTAAITAFLYDAEPFTALQEANDLICFYTREEPRNQHRWILQLKDTHQKIGTCGFHCWDRGSASVEIGYDLQPEYWKKGYGSEAVGAILSFAREQMQVKHVFAHIAEENLASLRLAEKLGFSRSDQVFYEQYHGEKYLHYRYELAL